MITCTSEMSGSASSGTWFSDQMPGKRQQQNAGEDEKAVSAHRSMIRESMSHASFSIDAQVLGGDCLAVLFRRHRYLPRSAGLKHARAFIEPLPFCVSVWSYSSRPCPSPASPP